MLKVIVDGGCRHRPQFSRGVWGHAPQNIFEVLVAVILQTDS